MVSSLLDCVASFVAVPLYVKLSRYQSFNLSSPSEHGKFIATKTAMRLQLMNTFTPTCFVNLKIKTCGATTYSIMYEIESKLFRALLFEMLHPFH